jgi:nucleotide-binding universal stress UspA family protein
MIAMRRILCPTDFSSLSARALDHAIALAGWYDAGLTVLHVSPLMPSVSGTSSLAIDPITLEPRGRERMVERVREFAAPALKAGLDTRCLLREGPIVADIVAQARQEGADLVALGTHGYGGLRRLLLGSVAEKVLRQAPCPVLTVAGAAEASVPHAPPSLARIVCAVDFSAPARRALSYALSLAQRAKARLTVLHVAEWPQGELRGHHAWFGSDYPEQIQNDALHELRAVVPPEARAWCDVHERVTLGTPWRRILHTLQDERADLAVLGVPGANAAEQLVFGSTANEVVRHAPCPVLTVRDLQRP